MSSDSDVLGVVGWVTQLVVDTTARNGISLPGFSKLPRSIIMCCSGMLLLLD
jgi:hypothetical protein